MTRDGKTIKLLVESDRYNVYIYREFHNKDVGGYWYCEHLEVPLDVKDIDKYLKSKKHSWKLVSGVGVIIDEDGKSKVEYMTPDEVREYIKEVSA